jgi:sedoheptulose-bisphosphatase
MRNFIVAAAILSTANAFVAVPNVNAVTHQRTKCLNVAAEKSTTQVDQAQPTIEQWITFAEPGLQKTMVAMFAACKEIAYKIRTASCDKMACFNEFGDEQLAIDVLANNVIFENLKSSGSCATASSEETPVEDPMGGSGYSVAFDPLDGSSIIDTNFAVGTIFGVWPGDRLVGINGRQLVGAGMAVYGPRTTMTIAMEGQEYSHEFLLVDDFSGRHGQWVKTNTFSTIENGKLFAPGNLRGTQDNPGYNQLFNYYLENKYQLRYTGGMVPDVNQLMVKGKGIFVNPVSPSASAKLRVLYEVAPIGYLIEKAGGKSSDGEKSVLDIPISTTEVRSQVAYGAKGEVERFEELVGCKMFVPLN